MAQLALSCFPAARLHPPERQREGHTREVRGEREERRRASGRARKSFAKGKKKSLPSSRVVPARGPAGWAGGRAGGQVGGVGVALRLRCCCPVRPLPTAHPQPRLQLWTVHPEPCAQTEVRRGQAGDHLGAVGKDLRGMLYLRGTLPCRGRPEAK